MTDADNILASYNQAMQVPLALGQLQRTQVVMTAAFLALVRGDTEALAKLRTPLSVHLAMGVKALGSTAESDAMVESVRVLAAAVGGPDAETVTAHVDRMFANLREADAGVCAIVEAAAPEELAEGRKILADAGVI